MVLVIRKDQMEVFRSAQDLQLARLLQAHLEEHHPDHLIQVPDDERQRRILCGIAEARGFGLSTVRTIGEFVTRTFTVGPAFFRQRNIAAALAAVARDPQPDFRFALMDLVLSAEDWREARCLAAPSDNSNSNDGEEP